MNTTGPGPQRGPGDLLATKMDPKWPLLKLDQEDGLEERPQTAKPKRKGKNDS